MKNYATYIVRCSDDSYYTGVTNAIEVRFAQHQEGIDPTCYTYKRRPLSLVHVEYFDDIRDAIDREKQIKAWSKKKKEALISGNAFLLKRLSRKKKGSDVPNETRVGVDVIIEGEHGTMLLVERCDDRCWALPGGWVHMDETPDQAAIREVKEETGLTITLQCVTDVHIRSSGTVHLTYVGCVTGGALLLQNNEVLRAEFLAPEDVRRWHADHRERVQRSMQRMTVPR